MLSLGLATNSVGLLFHPSPPLPFTPLSSALLPHPVLINQSLGSFQELHFNPNATGLLD